MFLLWHAYGEAVVDLLNVRQDEGQLEMSVAGYDRHLFMIMPQDTQVNGSTRSEAARSYTCSLPFCRGTVNNAARSAYPEKKSPPHKKWHQGLALSAIQSRECKDASALDIARHDINSNICIRMQLFV